MLSAIKNLLIKKAFASRTATEDPLQKYNYTVTIPGYTEGMGFQKCSGLSREINVTEYKEGGDPYTHKLPGREKAGEITLERGVYASEGLEKIYKDLLSKPDFRKTVVINLKDRFGKIQRTYNLAEAWVSKWEGTDFDSGSDDVAIEKITIQYEHLID